MNKAGRRKDNALIRTLANKELQNFATKRLLHDLKEMENEKIPTVGVTARPLSSDLFTWHANIKGPVDTLYQGGVFHFSIVFPEQYPHQPPKIQCLTDLPHPNVFASYICLDILNPRGNEESQGWSSGYSIQAILLQLQSFLFETNFHDDEKVWQNKVKKAVEQANYYQCTEKECQHSGKLSCWPKFNNKEDNLDSFSILDFDEREQFEKELICYHTKQNYKVNQLGLGLNVTKIPRTGALQHAGATLDYLSQKAYIKEGIRWSHNNERFTNWLPIYLGKSLEQKQLIDFSEFLTESEIKVKNTREDRELNDIQVKLDRDGKVKKEKRIHKQLDMKERAIHLGERAISFIMTNSTQQFRPEQVIELFTKIMVTTVFLLMEQKRHPSIRYIRLLTHIHTTYLLFTEKYPQLYEEVERRLQEFIKDESKRHKDYTPNLGALIGCLLVSKKCKFDDIVEAYMSEQFDRQVFWILKQVPELGNEKNMENMNQERADLTFRCQITSFQILCFYKLYLKTVKEKFSSPKELFENFENNFSKLSNKEENALQQGIFQIFQNINNFTSYYEFLGQKPKTLEQINAILKQSISNSKAKRYHGDQNELHSLPTSGDQIKALLTKIPRLEDYYETRTKKIEVKGGDKTQNFQITFKQKGVFNEAMWKDACVKRWPWIRDQLELNPALNPNEVYQKNIQIMLKGEITQQNRLYRNIQDKWINTQVSYQLPQIEWPTLNWELIFLTLDLEHSLMYFDQNPDFTSFYEKLEIAKSKLQTLTLPIIQTTNVKSGYFFWTQALTRLTNLKYLTICGTHEANGDLNMKGIKALNKGLMNFLQAKGSLEGIVVYNVNFSGSQVEIVDKIFSPLSQMNELNYISLGNTNMLALQNATKIIGNIISNLKNLQFLSLTDNAVKNAQGAKEIADGLMRAKKIQIVDISNNSLMQIEGLSSIIYNLSFSPKLQYLKMNNCVVSGSLANVVESLYRLLRISTSLEYLDVQNIPTLNTLLSKDFFVALGEIVSLKAINLSASGLFTDAVLQNFGKAIAFNCMKKKALQYINFNGTIDSNEKLRTLYNNMNISDHDNEIWYGDPSKASKMSGKDFDKYFYNGLKAFQFDQCPNLATSFNITTFRKYNKLEVEPSDILLISKSKSVTSLLLSKSNLRKQDAELLVYVLNKDRLDFNPNIRILNLSNNNLGKEGAKILSKLLVQYDFLEVLDISKNQIGVSGAKSIAENLTHNKSLRFLNLFNNKIGFDGAFALGEALAQNIGLQFLEIGHNRIRDKGLYEVIRGITKNQNSAVRTLGLRFNFLSEYGLKEFIQIAKKTKITEIFIKNNQLNEFGMLIFKQFCDSIGSIIKIDSQIQNLDQEKLDRTVFIHPITGLTKNYLKKFLQDDQSCGIITDIRFRKGPKWPNRTQAENYFAMVEFADVMSVTRALTVAAKRKAKIGSLVFRIYKAGTGTFLYQKKSAKQKLAESSKTNIPKITESGLLYKPERAPKDVRDVREPRRGGRGGGRGRGAPRRGR